MFVYIDENSHTGSAVSRYSVLLTRWQSDETLAQFKARVALLAGDEEEEEEMA